MQFDYTGSSGSATSRRGSVPATRFKLSSTGFHRGMDSTLTGSTTRVATASTAA